MITVLGVIGNVASCAFFLSSAPIICQIIKKKSAGGLSGDLFVFKLFNCMLWTFYGLPIIHPHNFWVVLTNALGSLFALMYIFPYLYYASQKQRCKVVWELSVILTLFVLMVVLLLLLEHSRDLKIMIVGILCAIISSLMHLTLLSQLRMVLQTKETKYMLPYSSVGAFFKGAVWTAYGLVNFDLYIMIPNGFGIVIGAVQLILLVILMCMKSKMNNPSNYLVSNVNEKEANLALVVV